MTLADAFAEIGKLPVWILLLPVLAPIGLRVALWFGVMAIQWIADKATEMGRR